MLTTVKTRTIGSCPTCHGTGKCTVCMGVGEVNTYSRNKYGGMRYYGRQECPACKGGGRCYQCAGSGWGQPVETVNR